MRNQQVKKKPPWEYKDNWKGVWIERGILEDKNLTYGEQILLGEVLNLEIEEEGCFAANRHFAAVLGINKQSAANMIQKLVDRKYLIAEVEKPRKGLPRGRRYLHLVPDKIANWRLDAVKFGKAIDRAEKAEKKRIEREFDEFTQRHTQTHRGITRNE